MAFTDSGIKSLKPKDKSYRVGDKGGTRGLNIQVTPSGRKCWMLRYTDPTGKRRFHTFGEYPGMGLSDARKKADDLKGEVRAKGVIEAHIEQPVERRIGTVKELLTGYWEDMEDRGKSSWKQVKSRLEKHVITHIGDYPANVVTEDLINAVLSKIYITGHRPLANRVRSYLLTAWKWGRQHDRDYRYLGDGIRFEITNNPVSDIPRDKAAETVDDRVLSWHEIKCLWFACQDVISAPMRLACQLTLVTGGQRTSEVLGMHDDELDLPGRLWVLPGERTKNSLSNLIPLSPLAVALIEKAKSMRGDSSYIFPKRGNDKEPARADSIYSSVRKYCAYTGIEDWTPKDLRTTFKTKGGEIGLSKEIRDRIQNHALSDVSSKHYDMWDYVPEKRAALDEWGRRLSSEFGLR